MQHVWVLLSHHAGLLYTVSKKRPGVRFERRKVDEKGKPTWKLKHANSILGSFKYFCQISSKSIHHTVSKLGRFLRQSVVSLVLVWSGKWNHLSTMRQTTNCTKNYCNRTLIVQFIVENMATFFSNTVYIINIWTIWHSTVKVYAIIYFGKKELSVV